MRAILIALTALCGALSSATAAHATGWSRLETIPARPYAYVDLPVSLAANGSGDVAVGWVDQRGVRVAVRRAGRRFAPAVKLPVPGDEFVRAIRLAMNGRGDLVAMWTYNDRSIPAPFYSRDDDCCIRLRLAVKPRGRRFAQARTVSTPGTDVASFDVAIGEDGSALAAWTQGRKLLLAHVGRGRRAGRPVLVRREKGIAVVSSVVYTRGRRVLVTWTEDRGGHTTIYSRYRRADGALGRTSATLETGFGQFAPVGTDRHGNQIALWTSYREGKIRWARRRAGHRFGRAHAVSLGSAGRLGYLARPLLSMGSDGTAVAAWLDGSASNPKIRAAVAAPRHGLGRVQDFRFPHAVREGAELTAAAGTRGTAFLAWERHGAGIRTLHTAVARHGRLGAVRGIPWRIRRANGMDPLLVAFGGHRAVAATPTSTAIGVSVYGAG
jgi:hypothetical protein